MPPGGRRVEQRSKVERAESMNRERVGEGRTAEVLAWGQGRVAKLYREGARRGGAANEFRVSRLVSDAGLPAPAVYDGGSADGVLEHDGRFGVIYERVDGVSMLREMARRPWKMRTYCREFARLHAELHAMRIPELPRQRGMLTRMIERAARAAGADLAARAQAALALLPDGDAVCHGDFHPDNILMSRRGSVVIDWEPASSGVAAADVARTVLLARYGGSPPGTSRGARILIALARRLFLRLYLRDYFARTEMTWPEVKAWLGVMAVARLADNIPGETRAIRRLAAARLGRSANA
jgi:Ser/Thr protein kinase RdoA (MazF antagonist)